MTENQSANIDLGSAEAEGIKRNRKKMEEKAYGETNSEEAKDRAQRDRERGIQSKLMWILVIGNSVFVAIPATYLILGWVSFFSDVNGEKLKVILDGLSVFVEQIVPVWVIYVLASIGAAGAVRVIQSLSDFVRSFRRGV